MSSCRLRALFKSTAGHRTMVDVNRLAREVLRMVDHDLHVHEVSVSTELQDVPKIMGDATQLQQVILNLIKNAIEALASGSAAMKAIRLVTTHDGNSVVSLYVQDTGPGIAPTSEANIFDPFFTTKTSGMGLGLSLSRRIIEDHGGDLRLAETTPKGCTFEIVLPSAAAKGSGSFRPTIATRVSSATGARHGCGVYVSKAPVQGAVVWMTVRMREPAVKNEEPGRLSPRLRLRCAKKGGEGQVALFTI